MEWLFQFPELLKPNLTAIDTAVRSFAVWADPVLSKISDGLRGMVNGINFLLSHIPVGLESAGGELRGMRLGTQLMGQAVQYARHRGRERIVLTCGADTEAFFAQFGFLTTGGQGDRRDMAMDIRLVIREIPEE